jgi:hypothetical protein
MTVCSQDAAGAKESLFVTGGTQAMNQRCLFDDLGFT